MQIFPVSTTNPDTQLPKITFSQAQVEEIKSYTNIVAEQLKNVMKDYSADQKKIVRKMVLNGTSLTLASAQGISYVELAQDAAEGKSLFLQSHYYLGAVPPQVKFSFVALLWFFNDIRRLFAPFKSELFLTKSDKTFIKKIIPFTIVSVLGTAATFAYYGLTPSVWVFLFLVAAMRAVENIIALRFIAEKLENLFSNKPPVLKVIHELNKVITYGIYSRIETASIVLLRNYQECGYGEDLKKLKEITFKHFNALNDVTGANSENKDEESAILPKTFKTNEALELLLAIIKQGRVKILPYDHNGIIGTIKSYGFDTLFGGIGLGDIGTIGYMYLTKNALKDLIHSFSDGDAWGLGSVVITPFALLIFGAARGVSKEITEFFFRQIYNKWRYKSLVDVPLAFRSNITKTLFSCAVAIFGYMDAQGYVPGQILNQSISNSILRLISQIMSYIGASLLHLYITCYILNKICEFVLRYFKSNDINVLAKFKGWLDDFSNVFYSKPVMGIELMYELLSFELNNSNNNNANPGQSEKQGKQEESAQPEQLNGLREMKELIENIMGQTFGDYQLSVVDKLISAKQITIEPTKLAEYATQRLAGYKISNPAVTELEALKWAEQNEKKIEADYKLNKFKEYLNNREIECTLDDLKSPLKFFEVLLRLQHDEENLLRKQKEVQASKSSFSVWKERFASVNPWKTNEADAKNVNNEPARQEKWWK